MISTDSEQAVPAAPAPLTAGSCATTLGLCLQPTEHAPASLRSAQSLGNWVTTHHHWVRRQLHHYGALWFGGFGLQTAADFAYVAQRVVGEDLKAYVGGDSPRTRIEGNVYSSTDFPPGHEIRLHNELSYGSWWPSIICFCCMQPSLSGGQTHLADGRRVWQTLPATIRERFDSLGVRYHQQLPDRAHAKGLKSWQDTFDTDDRHQVETICERGGMAWQWSTEGLRTTITRPGVVRHPQTGAMAWFNQADHWHAGMPGVKSAHAAEHGFAPLTHATYGNGEEISVGELEAVRATYQACENSRLWELGDLLVLDNLATLHGRKPYTGPRHVLAAMA